MYFYLGLHVIDIISDTIPAKWGFFIHFILTFCLYGTRFLKY